MPRMHSMRCRVALWYMSCRSISNRRSGGSPTARARCSCCTTWRATSTRRLRTCSGSSRGRRNHSCIMPGWRCGNISNNDDCGFRISGCGFEGETPMNDTWTERLSEYIDGTLPDAERAALEAHLAGCTACRTTLDELRRVVARARALDDRPPAADLWPAIAPPIGVSSGAHHVVSLAERRTRRVTFTVPQLAAAAAVLLLLGSGGAYLALRRPPVEGGGAIAQRGPAADLTTSPVGWVQKTSSRYDAAVAELQSALEQGRATGRLDSTTVRVLTQSLVTIDSAIVQARRALAADPGSAYLNQRVADTMRRKLELLRRARALAPART